ncbi:MAG: ROK family protein [Spirochaetaceae bacterium]
MAIAAIEAGGTKFICALFDEAGHEQDRVRIETGEPSRTLEQVREFFLESSIHDPISSVGIGSFGPINVDPGSEDYGRILQTPKTAWIGVNLRTSIQSSFSVPVSVESDVNVAALAESDAAGEGVQSLVYVTVGTGIGVGIAVEGRLLPLRRHPEMGHIRVRRSLEEQAAFAGVCPYHGDCLEGVAAGPAMRARWGQAAETLPPDHEAWGLEADYLGQAVATLMLSFSPDRVVLGGGVMEQQGMFERIRDQAHRFLGGYLAYASERSVLDRIVVPQALGGDAGIRGAYLIGRRLDRAR